jgi:hypothetical protein
MTAAIVTVMRGFGGDEVEARPDVQACCRLAHRYATFTGMVSMGEAAEIERELHGQRVARGWPDPRPALNGRRTIEPTIEGGIMSLWLRGMRVFDPRRKPDGDEGEGE